MRWQMLTVVLAMLVAAFTGPAHAERPPNVIIFFVDDLGWRDLGSYGSDLYRTPHVDRLAAEGVRFTDAYSASTVCSPTRAALMTGMAPDRTRVTDWIDGMWANRPDDWREDYPLQPPDWSKKLDLEYTTLAEALNEAGYRTAHLGKWHLTPRTDDSEQIEPYYPQNRGFDVNVAGNQWGAPGSYFWPYRRGRQEGLAARVANFPPDDQTRGRYLTNMKTDEAVRLIQQWQDQPFFIHFSYYQVHTPIQGRPDLVHLYQQKLASDEDRTHTNAEYAAMVEAVDRSVGRVRAKLEELGLDDDTIIIFTSDNGGLVHHRDGGPTDNAPLRAGKGSPYEGGVRVPTIVRWAGVTPAGAVSAEPIITHDFYPTILEMAGAEGDAEHNAAVDGLSLVPLLREPDRSLDRAALYWHYPHYHGGGSTPYTAVRAGDWRLIHFYEDDRVELYNLAEDIGEQHDLSEQRPDKAAELREMIERRREQVDAQPPRPNPLYHQP